jgi:Ca2+-binding RTX toxin-like protein
VQITTIDQSTRQVTLTPNANFNGTVQLLVGVRDQTARGGLPLDDPAQFDTQQFTLTVNAVNDAPTATAADLQVNANTSLEIQLAGEDVDLDTLTFAIVDQPANGTLSGFNADTGQVTYTPDTAFNGADTFTFTVSDGTETSDPATVTVTVSGAPVLNTIEDQTTPEDTPRTFTISAIDTDTDTLTFVVRDANNFAQLPPNVTVDIQTIDRTTRSVTLSPQANFNGTVALVAGVTDVAGATDISDFDTQPFMLTVTAVNDSPTTVGQIIQIQPGMAANIQLTADDGDPELNQAVTFEIVTQPSAGTIEQFDASAGTLVYQPGSRFTGSDSFTFRVRDDGGAVSQIATVTINGRTNAPIRAARLKHKTLKIKGSNAADQIDISLNDAGNMLIVQLNNNAEQMFPVRSVKRIKIYGRGGDDVITIASDVPIRAKVKGGDGNDNITGGAAKDRLYGNDGNDTINGNGGNDKIRGGRGNDSLMGGAGKDNIKGNKGNDVIEGGDGNDRLRGNKGNDTIMGGAGNDRIKGGRGRDVVDQEGTGQDNGGQTTANQIPTLNPVNNVSTSVDTQVEFLVSAADAETDPLSFVAFPLDTTQPQASQLRTDDHVQGNIAAPVTLLEFQDFQ